MKEEMSRHQSTSQQTTISSRHTTHKVDLMERTSILLLLDGTSLNQEQKLFTGRNLLLEVPTSDSSPVPQEQPIYAKPNIRGSSSDMYNRLSSNSPSYMTGSPDQYQYQRQHEPSPPVHGGSPNQFYGRQNSGERSPIIYTQQNSGGERTRQLSGESGGFSPRFDEGTRPVPGPQVPAAAISMQGTSKNKEAEVDALTSLSMENMSSSADPEFMGLYTRNFRCCPNHIACK
ncbi:unnamed protein product [Mytilus coruscus]|uniref:Uncharacterized protein n=1 Tax=Mytilus coruscus TaxID=42192 RepID=A0A6J8A346_MYTCO|nr:unnamed protein product [Mytilus coruscus]